jgi:NADH-quinone oxidoreductase subunit N
MRISQQKFLIILQSKSFLLAGAVSMVSFGNLAMFFLGLGAFIALYVLASSNRSSIQK